MTQLQREAIDSAVRAPPLALGGHPLEQRPLFEQMVTAVPIPDDVVTTPGHLGGVPVISVEIAGLTIEGVILYFHGGAFAIGSAPAPAPPARPICGLSPWTIAWPRKIPILRRRSTPCRRTGRCSTAVRMPPESRSRENLRVPTWRSPP